MAGARRLAASQSWGEAACLSRYGMRSLHEVFEVVGSLLTDSDLDVLSFLLDEAYPAAHPLDPAGWAVELEGWTGAACPRLQAAVQRYRGRRGSSTGVELLLELERRGVCDESNFNHLVQLLRILTRHDLMPFVTQKKRRTVSPERCSYGPVISGTEEEEEGGVRKSVAEMEGAGRGQWRAGVDPNRQSPAGSKRPRGKKHRGRKLNGLPRRAGGRGQGQQHSSAQHRVTCDVRLRVRAEYCDHDAALRGGVSSSKPGLAERQFDLFSQADALLRSRDLGAIVCDIKFSDLSYLDAFWKDYLSGALLEALRGVFITDSLRRAVGSEAVELLVSVDEEDYAEGRRRLLGDHGQPLR
ncbi:death effector domain-containing 1 [Polyodon spathula]|nr:death effector domain-containing 1 [Polyodon spathula]